MRNPLQLNINAEKRVYGLDVYRAIAIIVVVMGHGNYMIDLALPGFPWIRIVDGVELFFVLSGFLIGGILLRTINEKTTFGFKDTFHFWKRRWFRTVPNYMLILGLNYLFVMWGWSKGNLDSFSYKFVLFLQNFAGSFSGFFWESWSLTVEEWFYIFLPLLSLVCLRFLKPKQAILAVILLLIIIPLAYRIHISPMEVDKYWWRVEFKKTVLTRLDTIIYGVLAAWIKYYYPKFWHACRNYAFVIGLVVIYVTIYLPRDPNAFFFKTFYFNLTTLGAMLLLPKADAVKSYSTRFGKALTHISVISYSMYLINLGLVSTVISTHFMPSNALEGSLAYVIYWTIVLVVATLLYKGFERPMMNLRDRF